MQLRERIRRPFEASPVRSRTTHSSINCVASGSKARSIKVRVKLETCYHLRLLTSALPRIPNREVREANPIQPLYAVHSELRSVTRAWSEIDHVTISNSLMESITDIAHCYDVHVTACRSDHIPVRHLCNFRSQAHGGASCMNFW